MALGAVGANPETSTTVMQCATFHLSAFASREDSATPQWSTADLFNGFRILAMVRNAEPRVQQGFFVLGWLYQSNDTARAASCCHGGSNYTCHHVWQLKPGVGAPEHAFVATDGDSMHETETPTEA